ncbi:MAG: FAD:protein FMN transferase [Armatimonadetes bacterium]|nr:FAD:protein FMN transferase [Armatimonadota bacterium]MDW8154227.1 FAD:protein FMN transferase [Armatimonadota bacterium]
MSTRLFAGNFRAMGCSFRVCVATDSPRAARRTVALARARVEQWEAVLSRFREESALCSLNRSSGSPMRVHPVLWQALRWALWAAQATGGLYDPTVLDRLEAAGYRAGFEWAPDVHALPEPGPTGFGRWRLVRIHRLRPVVALPPGSRVGWARRSSRSAWPRR